MTTAPSEMKPGTWQVPESPWPIHYPPALLDEIRLAVMDAFFSIPRGGAEIGGVLFGSHSDTEVRISAFRPMQCEHLHGPTFVLSGKDLAELQTQLDAAANDPTLHGLEVVGWYHSHTRSEIFLSEADLEIYNRYFPQPWQIALVMRPAGMKPTRAGFFFRDREGAIHSSATYLEFVVGVAGEVTARPGNGRPLPHPTAPPARPPSSTLDSVKTEAPPPAEEPPALAVPAPPAGALQRVETLPARQPAELAPPVEMRPAEFVPPAYLLPAGQRQSRTRLWIALGLLAAAGLTAYLTAGSWLQPAKPPALRLQALDTQGQLRIQWDREAFASQNVQNGLLEIVDGQSTTAVPLDAAKIRLGSFQYARRAEMVEVHMTVRLVKGKSIEEFTSFIGHGPAPQPPPELDKQKEAELAAAAERARGDLKKEELRSAELQRSLDQMKQVMRREEERRRSENQMPAAGTQRAVPAAAPPPANTNPPPLLNPPPAAGRKPTPTPAAPPVIPPPPTVTSQVVKPQPPAQERPVQAPAPAPPPASPPPQPSAPPVAKPQAKPAQPAASLFLPLSGKWIHSPESASNSPFPPENAMLNLTESNGSVKGIFSARYRVRNTRFNGRVTFSFEGPVQPGTLKYPFTSSDGMKGTIEIIRLPGRQHTIEVVWISERDKLTFDDLYFRVP